MVWFATWLWQGVALTLLTALVLHTSRAVNAATRYALWWLTLLVICTHPLATSVAPWLSPAALDLADASVAPHHTLFAFTVPHVPLWVLETAALLWLAAVLCNLVRFAGAVRGVRALRRSAVPIDPAIEARLPLWRAASRDGRRVRLCASDRTPMPCALGLGRPLVIVPNRLLRTLDPRDLDQIVVHEHAHLQRYDDWGRFVQVLIELLVPFHPAVRWIAARLDLEREIASDDWVIARTGQPATYARCLTRLAEQMTPCAAPRLTPAALRRRAQMLSRVQRLLDPARNARPRVSTWAAVALAIVLVALSGRAVRLLGIREAGFFDPVADVHAEETLASHDFTNADALSLGSLPSLDLDLGEPAHAATPASLGPLSSQPLRPRMETAPTPASLVAPLAGPAAFSRGLVPLSADAPDPIDWDEIDSALHDLDDRRALQFRPISLALDRIAEGAGPPDDDDDDPLPSLPILLDADSPPSAHDDAVVHPDQPLAVRAGMPAPPTQVGVPKKPQFFTRMGRSVARLFGVHVRSPGQHKPATGKRKARADVPRRADLKGRVAGPAA